LYLISFPGEEPDIDGEKKELRKEEKNNTGATNAKMRERRELV